MNNCLRSAGWLGMIAAVVVLAGCGSGAPPSSGGSGSSAPSRSAPAPTATPSATAAPSPSATSSSPGSTVLSYRVSYPWHWPDDAADPAVVQHTYPVPPVAELISVNVGDHPAQSGDRHYDRMSFTFSTAFPGYRVAYVDSLVADPSGKPVSLPGDGILKVTFSEAQAHTDQGASSVKSEPPARLGLSRLLAWAPAGDFEGVLTFGIGIAWPVSHSNPQIPIRISEVETTTPHGQHRYIIAIDVDATTPTPAS